MKKYLSPINIIFTAALSLVVLIAFNIIPREGAFVFLLLYVFFVLFYPVERGVDLFLRSIPFFIALPITESFDNLNIWRVVLALIFVKWFFVEYDWKKWLRFKFSREDIKKFAKENKIELAGITFLVVASLSVFAGPDIVAGVKRFLYILNGVMLFIVIRSMVVKSKDNAFSFAKNFAYSGLLAVGFGYLQFIAAYFVPAWVFHYWWGQMVSVAMYGQEWGDIVTDFGNTWFSYSGDTLRLRMFSTFPDSHSFPMYVIMTFPALFLWVFERFSLAPISHTLSNSPARNLRSLSASLFSAFGGKTMPARPARGFEIGQEKTSLEYSESLQEVRSEELSEAEKLGKGFSAESAGAPSRWSEATPVRRRKLLASSFAIFSLINLALILSGTRGIWLASVAALVVMGIFKFAKIDKKFSRVILASFLVFLLMFPLYFGIVSFRQFQDTDFEGSASIARIRSIIDFGETSNQGRIYIWKETIEYITYSPVWGVGMGNYPIILSEPQTASAAGSSAHNLYLHIASTVGVFGLAAFLWMVFEVVREGVKYLKQNPEKRWALYFAVMLFSLAWVGAYLMTDAALYDGRALLGFMAMVALSTGLLRDSASQL